MPVLKSDWKVPALRDGELTRAPSDTARHPNMGIFLFIVISYWMLGAARIWMAIKSAILF
jgi:hypothetical protein